MSCFNQEVPKLTGTGKLVDLVEKLSSSTTVVGEDV